MAKIVKILQEFRRERHLLKSRVITIVSCEKNVPTPTTHTVATAIRKCTSGQRSRRYQNNTVCAVFLCVALQCRHCPGPGQWPCIRVAHLMGTLLPWISLCSGSLPTFSQEQRPTGQEMLNLLCPAHRAALPQG